MTEERRRSRRHTLEREEIAIVQDQQDDRPATLIDFSTTGALVSLIELAGIRECLAKVGDPVELWLHVDALSFYVRARVVRRGPPRFLAVKFVETREESLEAINAKCRRLAQLQTSKMRTANA